MRPWFRFYSEVVDDPKVQKLTPELFRAWINFLCLTCRNDGRFICVSDVAFGLRISEDDARFTLGQLETAGLVELNAKSKTYRPHNWNERQFESDVSTERVRRFRKRRRNVSGNAPEQSRTEEPPIVPLKGDVQAVSSGTVTYSPDFEIFWTAYPRKEAKGAAWSAWKRLHPTKPLQADMLAALARQRASQKWREDNGRYIPHPATWINKRRWEDSPSVENVTSYRPKGVVL